MIRRIPVPKDKIGIVKKLLTREKVVVVKRQLQKIINKNLDQSFNKILHNAIEIIEELEEESKERDSDIRRIVKHSFHDVQELVDRESLNHETFRG